ncbi:MAG: sensor domain-containing diguanylate cyclase [Anaerolineales bacterium]|nr:sensor domain-containing diguanylate cyclase [Anaerolineales bacterium]MDW8227824.1 sensor domain-containing diguanylate cyclase [Anaerolineales bacterium]
MKSEDLYRQILDNMYDGVYLVDQERRILYWNKGAERITGYPAEKVVGTKCSDNLLNHVTESGQELCFGGCPLYATMQDGQERQAEVFLHHAQGYRVPVLVRTAPLYDENRQIRGAVEVFSDNRLLFSTRRRMRHLEETVSLDPLTGISNRRYIEARLRAALNALEQDLLPFGVLFLDIDFFKRVNDTYGHEIGDEVLKMVAKTLQQNIRQEDIAARWGGEEFVILLMNTDARGLLLAAEKLRALVKASSLRVGNKYISVTVSIGGTLAQPGDDLTTLLRRVDQNMYRSKLTGRDRVICDPE